MIVSPRNRSHAGALPKVHGDAPQAKTKKESRANRARRLSRSRIPKASAPRLHQKNHLRPEKQNPLSHKPSFGSCPEGFAMPISSEPAPSHRPWVSSYRARPRYAEFHHSTTNFTAADTNRESFFTPRPAAIHFGKKVKCDRRGTKPGMLGVDRVGNRRSEAILAPNFSEKTGDQHKKTENGQERKGFTSGELRDESRRYRE